MISDRRPPNDLDFQPLPRSGPDRSGYRSAVLSTLVATVVGWPLYHGFNWPRAGRTPVLENTNVLMLYLLAVLWVATRHGRGAALLASVLGVATFDVCFVPPYLRLAAHDPQYVVTFAVMLLTALTISTLTHRVRQQADTARAREGRARTLLAFSRELAAAPTSADIVDVTERRLGQVMAARVALLLCGPAGVLVPRPAAVGGAGRPLDEHVYALAKQALADDRPVEGGTDVETAVFVPARASRGPVGVLGALRPASGTGAAPARLAPETRELVEAFAAQAATALERATLAEEARGAWERVEAEFLRNTLLSGVSHDLRTPLAAITGAVTSLTQTGETLPPAARAEMLDTIYAESERMERLITNLLDMTRLDAGGLRLRKDWQSLQEVVGSALRQLDRRLSDRQVLIDVPADLPLIQFDGTAVEQVIVNLIDNALEYTPPTCPLEIAARVDAGALTVEVADRGPGLPPGAEARVFEKFFRAQPAGTPSRRGVGLGLAICRGVVEAHGGTITAWNRPGGGAAFRFTLPVGVGPPAVNEPA